MLEPRFRLLRIPMQSYVVIGINLFWQDFDVKLKRKHFHNFVWISLQVSLLGLQQTCPIGQCCLKTY